jgi:hypothetical protein
MLPLIILLGSLESLNNTWSSPKKKSFEKSLQQICIYTTVLLNHWSTTASSLPPALSLSLSLSLYIYIYIYLPLSVAVLSNEEAYNRLIFGIAVSNPAVGMVVCLLLCCVL